MRLGFAGLWRTAASTAAPLAAGARGTCGETAEARSRLVRVRGGGKVGVRVGIRVRVRVRVTFWAGVRVT